MRGWGRSIPLALAALLVTTGLGSTAEFHLYLPDSSVSSLEPAAIYPWESPWVQGELRCQYLLPASLLSGRVFWVKDLAFAATVIRPGAEGGLDASVCQIRIAHCRRTSLSTTFADNLEADLTRVHEAPLRWVPVSYQWWDVGLNRPDNSPFVYNGRDNMVLEIRFKVTAPYTCNSVWCCGSHSLQIVKNRFPGAYSAAQDDGFPVGPSAIAKVRIAAGDAILLAGAASPRIGTDADWVLYAPPDANLPYQLGSSLGRGPIPLGSRQIPLALDALLVLTAGNHAPHIFVGYAGTLDASGRGAARIRIPQATALIGITLHSAFVTIDSKEPFGIKSISNPAAVRIAS
ncbi:MAG: hypothetical protein JXQ29_10225 [Planctomycetes bacterium]|nr:hypothetical protein [Planctomycetota bacterium]